MAGGPDARTLSPLPSVLRHGLRAVAALGFLSFFASVTLFLLLSYRIITWARNGKRINQFALLIWNLVVADIQQSIAFLLNTEWLIRDSIAVGTPSCWAQGWFVSTGDLSSGVWCLAIGIHTFASVILNYRLSSTAFFSAVISLWLFVYLLSLIPVMLHPTNIYVRAGAWVSKNLYASRTFKIPHVQGDEAGNTQICQLTIISSAGLILLIPTFACGRTTSSSSARNSAPS
jgi:hypothetical protein